MNCIDIVDIKLEFRKSRPTQELACHGPVTLINRLEELPLQERFQSKQVIKRWSAAESFTTKVNFSTSTIRQL